MIKIEAISFTEVGVEPVTLIEAKAWAVIDHADDDDSVTKMLPGARQDIENAIGGARLIEGACVVYLETTQPNEKLYQLPGALSISEVSELKVYSIEDGEEDALQTLNEDYYFNGRLKIPNAGMYKLEYTVTPVVPQALKEAVKMLVAYRYKYRSDQDKDKQQGLPEDVAKKVEKYVQIWL